MERINLKRCAYDWDNNLYLIKREDVEKLFEMACFDYKRNKVLTEWYLDEHDRNVAMQEHRLVLGEVIAKLGLYRDYLDYYSAHLDEE